MACAGQEHSQNCPSAPPTPSELDIGSGRQDSENRETSESDLFRAFQELHDRAFAMVQRGLTADEEGDSAAAYQYYSSSLPLLDQVLATDCENWPGSSSAQVTAVQQMQLKMNKTRQQITCRVESLQTHSQAPSVPDADFGSEMGEGVRLPSYEEAVSSGPPTPMSGAEAEGNMMMSGDHSSHSYDHLTTDGTELFYIADGVQIFHITCEGYVSTPSYPASLRIVSFQESSESDRGSEYWAQSAAHAFLQVGDWLYPLIPGASPVLHTTYGAYLFPDLSADGTGSSVGMILPETLTQEEHHTLEDILRNFSVIQEQQVPTPQEDGSLPSAPMLEPQDTLIPRAETEAREEDQGTSSTADHSTSAKISHGIIVASSWISWGLGKGAEKAGYWISYGSAKLRERLHPEKNPRPVDPRVKKGVMYARKASNTAVSVSAFIVTKLGEATMALGRRVAPHICKKGEELLPKSVKTEENKSRLHGVMEVAASGLRGFGTVWVSLEAAAKALGRSVAKETVATVHHKYGEDASKLAEDTVYTAGNVAMTVYTAESLAIKAIVKRTAKDATSALVNDLREKDEEGQADGHSDGPGDGDGDEGGTKDKKDSKPPL